MTKDAKFRFLTKLEEMAEALYQAGDSVSHDAAWEHRRNYLWGYCSAGKTIELVGAEEIQHVIDRAHLKVYGEARSARTERLKPLGIGSEAPDWDAFDEPTLIFAQWVSNSGSTDSSTILGRVTCKPGVRSISR